MTMTHRGVLVLAGGLLIGLASCGSSSQVARQDTAPMTPGAQHTAPGTPPEVAPATEPAPSPQVAPVTEPAPAPPDADGDKIADADDKCPNEPETYNGGDDDDGCPDKGRVIVTETHIEIIDHVYFDKGSDVILEKSRPILPLIARVLAENPGIKRVELIGYSETLEARSGKARSELGQRRASAVLAALLEAGVEAGRLQASSGAAGNPRRPCKKAKDPGCAENRRVEFVILERD
ncbi:MAG: OmpA family protein [Deltaproteobacteria bacterium]|nr:OmpA family protein [Deltaproteobacteria bacterium]